MKYVFWLDRGDPLAHARPKGLRNHRAICGAYLSSYSCLNLRIKPECPACVKIIVGQIVKTHELKTWPVPFEAVLKGVKHHEVRVNDRDFQPGDVLHLREWDPRTVSSAEGDRLGQYTGRELFATVTYITTGGRFGLPENLCVMSIIPGTPEDRQKNIDHCNALINEARRLLDEHAKKTGTTFIGRDDHSPDCKRSMCDQGMHCYEQHRRRGRNV